MSGMWKRSHGRTSEAPPDERGGYRYVRPTATAPHLDSTLAGSSCARRRRSGMAPVALRPNLPAVQIRLDFAGIESVHAGGLPTACLNLAGWPLALAGM